MGTSGPMRLFVALFLAVTVAACGSGGLTDREQLTIAEAEMHFSRVVADGRDYRESQHSVDRLIAIYRDKPDAEYAGRTVEQVVQDAASTLEGHEPGMAAELDRALGN